MSAEGKTVALYDLAADWCEECGRPKMNRLLGFATGCKACDEVVTRHRCTAKPDIAEMEVSESWECRDCGTVWTARAVEEDCRECGHPRLVKSWDAAPGDRIDTAPRYEAPRILAHLANLGRRPAARAMAWRSRWAVREALEQQLGTEVPEKLFMAKARKLILRKKLNGCYCGCRGDFYLPGENG